MPSDTCILSWLEHLWPLYPAQGVLVVGAGNGSSPWIDALQRWNAPSVILVEADDAQFQHLQRNMPEREGWQLRKQVVAAETGSVTYHHASNPAESGLVEPENLRPLWPNLKTRQTSTRQSISLAELLAVTEPTANWLLLDCLPAGALLAGAGDALATCDVIVTRALLPEAGADLPAAQADASTITELLQAQGFCTVATQTSRHPGVAHTLHVRDRSAQLAQLNAALAEARETLQQALQDSLQATLAAQATLAEHVAHNQTLQHELAAMQEQLAQTTQAQVTAKQALEYRDAKLKALQAELLQAKQSVQQATQKAEQMQQQLTALQAETDQCREAAVKALTYARQTKVASSKAIEERDAKLELLQTELIKMNQYVRQVGEQTAQTKQRMDSLQDEATQWREAAEKARVDSAQSQTLASQVLIERDAQLKALQDELLITKENEAKSRAAQQLEIQEKAEILGQLKALKQKNIDLARAKDDEAAARAADSQAKASAIARAEKLQLELTKPKKNQDADIDDFINDLSDLFYGMSLSYVDVGAFTGQVYKKLLDSKKVSIREAHLYEPNPDSHAELKKVLIPGHAHAYQVAVSDSTGVVNLIPGRSMTRIVDDSHSGLSDIFTVNCVKLDEQSELYTDKKINLLKIDVEGSELNVLRGASNLLLNQWIDLIYIEVGFNSEGTQQTYFGKIDEFLQKFNYRVYKIYEQKNEWISDSPLLRRCNFAYLSSRFAALRPTSLLKQISKNR